MFKFLKNLFSKKVVASTGFTSVGGIDTRIYINDVVVGNCQGISFGRRQGDTNGGTMVLVLFDKMEHVDWLGKEAKLGVLVHDHKGTPVTIYHAKIRFDNHERFGVSVDDIVIDIMLDFTVVERYTEDYKRPETNHD